MKSRFDYNMLAALVGAAGLMVAATQAHAHAHLISAAPAANSTVSSPRQMTLKFTEDLAPKFSGFDLMKADGAAAAMTTRVPASDAKSMVGVVAAPLPAGSYMVMWHAVSARNGHRTEGNFNFTVH
jgi:methionine-rich copper-binding protein CopC